MSLVSLSTRCLPALTALVRDITERKEYETRLEESEQRHRSMTAALDTSKVGTFILDDDCRIVWLNQAIEGFFGVNRDELIGADKRQTIKSEIKHIFEAPDRFEQAVLASHEENTHVESFECHVLPDADREERWLIHWSTPITKGLYAGGRIKHYTDITERKQYEHQLEEQRNDLRVLNQLLRHDIRNDLQLVTAYTEILRDKCDHEEELEYLEIIRESADHAVELTTTARNMADVMLTDETDLQNRNLATVLDQELEALRSDYPQAIITTETPIPDVRVRANEMLDSVFRNVLKNAAQHNNNDILKVSVSVTVREETVCVRIADNGPGVPDEQKSKIFGEGEKGLDSSGSGMGLYLVQTLVTSYGGDVWVEDNDPTGAVFVVELPVAG